MKKVLFLAFVLAMSIGTVFAQEGDVAFGVGTLTSPGPSAAVINSGIFFAPSMGGGAYLSLSGDFLIRHRLGVGGEVAWRASQNLYQGFQPYRPILYDFYGIYAPKLNKHVGAELLAGIGGESLRFYTNFFTCNFSGCTNYVSSNHFMGAFGAGLKFYPTGGNWFIRPEVRLYLINNNFEFSSGRAVRYGGSLGYTFGGSNY